MRIPDQIREDIPLTREVIYFDNASTSLKPEPVVRAMDEYYHEYGGNVHRGIHSLSQKTTTLFEESREKVAKIINASKEEIIFVKNATEALNFIASGLDWKAGDKVVSTELEHHSNFIPFFRLREKGVIFEVIKCSNEGSMEIAETEEKLSNSKLFTFSYVSGVLGNVLPVEDYAKRARSTGALVCIDATQAVGHREVDVEKIGCDFLVFSGHTGLLGPTGVGVLYVKESIIDELAPVFIGDGTITDVSQDTYKLLSPPQKYEAGTPNIGGVIGLGAAVDYINEIGVRTIEEYEKTLTEKTLSAFEDMEKLAWYGPRENHAGIISFNIKNLNPHDVAAILDSHSLAIGSGFHCSIPLMKNLGVEGAARASYHCYNTEEEIEKMVALLREVATDIA